MSDGSSYEVSKQNKRYKNNYGNVEYSKFFRITFLKFCHKKLKIDIMQIFW